MADVAIAAAMSSERPLCSGFFLIKHGDSIEAMLDEKAKNFTVGRIPA